MDAWRLSAQRVPRPGRAAAAHHSKSAARRERVYRGDRRLDSVAAHTEHRRRSPLEPTGGRPKMRFPPEPSPRGPRRRSAPFALLLFVLPCARAQEPAAPPAPPAPGAAAAAAAAMTPEQALEELRSKRDDADPQ